MAPLKPSRRRGRTHRIGQIALVVVLLLLLGTTATLPFVVGARAGGDAPPLAPIDADHSLDCGEYQRTGRTASNHTAPELTITLAKQPSQVGLEESWTDAKTKNYLRIEYDEERERTLRIWIPAKCVDPYANKPVTAITGGPTAGYTIKRDNGSRYLQVRVTVTGRTDAVYPISVSSGWSFDVFHGVSSRVEKLFGKNVTEGPQWTYIDKSRLQGANATAKISLGTNASDPLFQYRTGNQSWAVVPDEATHPAPVYKFEKTGVNSTIWVVSEVDDPPQVRYVRRSDVSTDAQGIMSDIGNAINNMLHDATEAIDFIWGGD